MIDIWVLLVNSTSHFERLVYIFLATFQCNLSDRITDILPLTVLHSCLLYCILALLSGESVVWIVYIFSFRVHGNLILLLILLSFIKLSISIKKSFGTLLSCSFLIKYARMNIEPLTFEWVTRLIDKWHPKSWDLWSVLRMWFIRILSDCVYFSLGIVYLMINFLWLSAFSWFPHKSPLIWRICIESYLLLWSSLNPTIFLWVNFVLLCRNSELLHTF